MRSLTHHGKITKGTATHTRMYSLHKWVDAVMTDKELYVFCWSLCSERHSSVMLDYCLNAHKFDARNVYESLLVRTIYHLICQLQVGHWICSLCFKIQAACPL